jgi:hypothetical protein
MFGKHRTLKELIISTGRDNMILRVLTKLVKICPNLEFLGSRNDIFDIP